MRSITAPDEDFVKRPEPKPPLDARPKHFSVTEIETLRRDPYAIFARRILRLRPIEPLIRDPDVAERGSLFHDILAHFTEQGIDPLHQDAVGTSSGNRTALFRRYRAAGRNRCGLVAAVSVSGSGISPMGTATVRTS